MSKQLTDYIDIKALQRLMEKFTKATGATNAIIDLEGNILTACGWQDICTKFYRVNPESCKNCLESDTSIANGIKEGKEYNVYKCINGLVDVATPIKVNGEHIANLFIGQFLSEEPDIDFFKQQAKKYGFNEESFLKALSRVTILSDEEVKNKMDFLSELAKLIGEMSMNKLQLSNLTENLEKKVDERTKELKEAQMATLNMMQDAEETRQEVERMNLQLFKQQEQMKSMFDGIEDVIYVADPDTYELLYVNGIAKKYWGDDIVGKLCYKILQGRKSPCPFCTNKKIFENPGESVIWEFQNEMNKRWFRCFDKAIHWSDDKLVRFEMAIDITEMKDAQQNLIREKQISESVINSVPGVFYQIDADGNFIRWNDQFTKITGYTDEEMAKIHPLTLFEGKDKDRVESAIMKVFVEGYSDVEADFVTKYGEKFPYLFTGNLYEVDEKQYMIGTGLDVSDLKDVQNNLSKMNEELNDSNEQLERFAYVASHDLQEPLRKIKNFSDLLISHLGDELDEKSSKYLNYVTSGSQRMQRLINDLLQFSRISTRGKAFELCDMNAVLSRSIDSLSFYIKEKNASIEHDSMPRLKGDASQLATVLQNLINNGIKFCDKENPIVKISAHDEPEYWHFSVSDNGIGIEKNYHDRIFIIFQRLHSKDRFEGTGIGLALCKKIVERHKGRIWLNSTPAEGSTFHFTISKSLT